MDGRPVSDPVCRGLSPKRMVVFQREKSVPRSGMTPLKLILFRIALVLFGWIPLTGSILHRVLVWLYVKRSHRPYGASSRFYTPEDLG